MNISSGKNYENLEVLGHVQVPGMRSQMHIRNHNILHGL